MAECRGNYEFALRVRKFARQASALLIGIVALGGVKCAAASQAYNSIFQEMPLTKSIVVELLPVHVNRSDTISYTTDFVWRNGSDRRSREFRFDCQIASGIPSKFTHDDATPTSQFVSWGLAEILYLNADLGAIVRNSSARLADENISPQLPPFRVALHPTLVSGGEKGGSRERHREFFQPRVFSFVSAALIVGGAWVCILQAVGPWQWLFGFFLIVFGYIGQLNYPVFEYIIGSEWASVFCGSDGASATACGRAKDAQLCHIVAIRAAESTLPCPLPPIRPDIGADRSAFRAHHAGLK
jgi:hypothetical protein